MRTEVGRWTPHAGALATRCRSLRYSLKSRLFHADPIITAVGASAVASALSRMIGLVRNVALAWLIPQAQFGLFGLAVLTINILLPLCSAGLYEGITRYAPLHEAAGTLRRFTVRAAVLLAAVVVPTGISLWVFARPCGALLFSAAQTITATGAIPVDRDTSLVLLRATACCVVALAVFQALSGFFKGLHMFRAYGLTDVVGSLLFTILAVGGAWIGFTNASSMILAYALACGAGVLLFAPGWLTHVFRRKDAAAAALHVGEITHKGTAGAPIQPSTVQPAGRLISYSLWAAGTAVSWHVMAYFPVWYLLKRTDADTVGAFHAVRTITQVMQLGAVLLTAVVAANVTRMWEHDGRNAAIPRLTLLTKGSLLLFLVGAVLLLVARPVVLRLFPASFAQGASAYHPLVLSFLLVGVTGLVAVRLNLLEKPRLVCLAWCVGTVVNFVVSYVLIRPPGESTLWPGMGPLPAAAWASVSAVTAAMIVCLVAVRRQHLGVDRSSLVLTGVCFLIGLGPVVALPAVVLLVAVAVFTRTVFTGDEWSFIRRRVAGFTSP